MNETLEQARARYQVTLVEANVAPRGGYKDTRAYQNGGTSKVVTVNGVKKAVPTAVKRTSGTPDNHIVLGPSSFKGYPDDVDPKLVEEEGEMMEGDESTSEPGADEGKPAPKKMADLLSEARAKFQENLIKNSAPSAGSLPQAKASFAEGLKNHCKKGK